MEIYTRWTALGPVTGTSRLLVNAAVEALASTTPATVARLVPAQRPVVADDALVVAAA